MYVNFNFTLKVKISIIENKHLEFGAYLDVPNSFIKLNYVTRRV